jgi:hypothetical protein
MDSRCALNPRVRPRGDHGGMETLHSLADWAWRESWNRAFWPSLAITLAAALDGCTRGPSITAMVLANLSYFLR